MTAPTVHVLYRGESIDVTDVERCHCEGRSEGWSGWLTAKCVDTTHTHHFRAEQALVTA